MQQPGTLYFLTNPSMPGLVKIGHTTGVVDERVQKLSSTGVPTPFEVVATFSVSDSAQCEAVVHQQLQPYRNNPKREFFSGDAAVLIRESIEAIAPFLDATTVAATEEESAEIFEPDQDDITFMFYLLHECYEQGMSWPSKWLAENHSKYSPITVDLKMMTLEEHGYVKRTNRPHEGVGEWAILPKGVKFMIDNNHHDQTLLDESITKHR